MSNKLEDFVKAHRGEFDAVKPSAGLWQKIDTGVKAPASAAGKLAWLKYLAVGVPVITVAAYLALSNTPPEHTKVNKQNATAVAVQAAAPQALQVPATREVNSQIPGMNMQNSTADSAAPVSAVIQLERTDRQ
jgi:hypothetical protein